MGQLAKLISQANKSQKGMEILVDQTAVTRVPVNQPEDDPQTEDLHNKLHELEAALFPCLHLSQPAIREIIKSLSDLRKTL